ncbi:hypothetical protein [Cryptosporangium sp. NPDC048952]|uniref:hypothetical protein n=1 Tax=Cryptosporangium sp. NPDC048952 TaxID=3363961 RepID=UPI003718A023
MNDIKRLLAAAVNEESTPMTFDPSDDVARGRRHVARRRTALVSGVAAAALLVGGGAVLITSSLPGGDENTRTNPAVMRQTGGPAAEETSGVGPPVEVKEVTLVAYTGKQPKGYKVTQVPDGWEIQGGTESSLVIAPKGAADQDPNSFVDKIAVLSTSSDAPPESLTEGKKVPVGDGVGYYRLAPSQILTYQDTTSGRWVDIQVPEQLHWDAARIGEFAAGVTVVGGAGDSHG